MENKKEYTPREAAIGVLDRVKKMAQERLTKSLEKKEESLEKAAPQNQSSAEAAGIKMPQPPMPKAPEKVIPKQKELKLKKFIDFRNDKKMKKAAK